ncbi:assimilatory nitrate reductase electron transfer subunit/nitrite reductase (NADH) large subunit [Nocardioides sp. J9]|uniref:FAD-dependent oxidoreductase n=1 Tax=Nocardioides sp. J9 TaxID=935844 RepID=UPI0011ABD276|nr:FAD-dependent oxidoreductase [Nocardioides sp. J9]TWH02719.1 assimilatory nitrate reductase electron transfer subunit/nitrite reductase (NADH) large subunit [Nocardioides sp. J9]
MTESHRPDQPLERLVVVGSGMAATRLVEELVARRATERYAITVLGDEPVAPYNRILLSAVLEGTHRVESITLRSPGWYAEHGIDLRLGARVLGVDRDHRDVMLVDGTLVEYDVLVLATGSIPTLPPIRGLVRMDGSLHDAVHAFRSLGDCERLLAAVTATDADGRPANRRAVVVGGGLLGLQVARALGTRGLDTEIVEGAEHLLHQQISTAAGRILARDLKKLGVAVYTGARAIRLHTHDHAHVHDPARDGAPAADAPGGVLGQGQVRVLDPLPRNPGRVALRLDNGFTLDTDLVVLTAGGRPSTALARGAGLEVRRGIVVDDRLASVTDPSVHALGDCVEHAGRTTGFVPPAWEQAGILAAALCGEPARYDGARVVARLRATDLDVAVLGDAEREVAAGGEVVEVSNPISGSHRRLVVRDGRIVAATLVGDLSRVGLITQHFDRQTVLGAREPGNLLMPERTEEDSAGNVARALPDDAEVCACAGVTAGRIRACSSLEQVRDTTRATTGCGGCASTVRELLATTSSADLATSRKGS